MKGTDARNSQAGRHARLRLEQRRKRMEQRYRRLLALYPKDHQREPVARHREDLREPQGPELGDREHVAERGTRRHGTLSR